MTAFIDVGVQRIQEYLGRSRSLWGRRGGSDLLLYATDVAMSAQGAELGLPDIATLLATTYPDVHVNDQAIALDGVLSLESSDARSGWAAGIAVARGIRAALPGATVQVSQREAPRYTATFGDSPPSRTETFLPRAYDFPLQKLCDECGQAGAVHRYAEKSLTVCPDCWARRPQTPRGRLYRTLASAHSTSGFLAEQRLWETLTTERASDLKIADDFSVIAGLPGTSEVSHRTTEDNHIATVFADGNSLGGLFAEARARVAQDEPDALEDLRALSTSIKDATFDALVGATRAILQDTDAYLPVIPHIQGGDDVLVTVPAPRVWRFIRTFLALSAEGYAKHGTHGRSPTMSLGVVICHQTYPIGDQVELAEDLLRQAKDHVSGDGMSLAWCDITWDGPRPAPGRRPWTVEELERRASALDHAVATPASTRSSLRTIIAEPDATARWARLVHLAARMPVAADFVGAVLGADWRKDEQISAPQANLILDVLSASRWWA